MAGAPKGNQNAAKAKQWTAAIERALDKRSPSDRKKALDKLAEKLLARCDEGSLAALQELGNRLEGKVQANVSVSGTIGHAHLVVTVQDARARLDELLGRRADSDTEVVSTH